MFQNSAKHGDFMDKMKLGGGGRYEKLIGSLEKKGVREPKALAAAIGMKKYGKKRFLSLAAKGRRRAEREKANA
jgi:histidyl-tRNA synthetase